MIAPKLPLYAVLTGILLVPADLVIEARRDTVFVRADADLQLRLLHTVSSAESRVNEHVDFEVVEDLVQDDMVIVPRGSKAWGVVTAVEPKSRLRKNGKLDIDLQAVCLPDGTGAALRAYRRGSTQVPGDQPSAGDSLFALPALPVLVFLYGKDVTIPKGREFTAYLGEDIEVKRTRGRPAPSGNCSSPAEREAARKAPVIAQPDLSSVVIRSKPEGAEILLNDRFMGQTPATLRLQPGEYKLRLTLPNKAKWERTVVITPGGDSTIQASLESTVPDRVTDPAPWRKTNEKTAQR